MAKKEILIVDSNQEDSSQLKQLFEKEGYEVLTAFNNQEALDILSQYKPNICILDIILPSSGISGLELLQKIKKADMTTICLILTSIDDLTHRKAARIFAADGYFIKPVDKKVILEAIKIGIYAQEKLRRPKKGKWQKL